MVGLGKSPRLLTEMTRSRAQLPQQESASGLGLCSRGAVAQGSYWVFTASEVARSSWMATDCSLPSPGLRGKLGGTSKANRRRWWVW